VGRYKIIVSSRADKFLDELKGKKGYYRLRIGKIRTNHMQKAEECQYGEQTP